MELLFSCVQPFCNPMDYSLPGSSVYGISQAGNAGVGCHFLLHCFFLTQGSNLHLLHRHTESLLLSHQKSPQSLETCGTYTHIHTYTHTHTHTHTPLCNCQIDGGYRNLQHSILFPCTSSQEISSHQPNTMNPVIQNNFTYSSSLYTRDHIMCTLLYVISFIHTMPMRYILVIEHSSKLNIDCSV